MPGALPFHSMSAGNLHERRAIAWASAVAILFAVIAAVSCALDLTVSISKPLGDPPRIGGATR